MNPFLPIDFMKLFPNLSCRIDRAVLQNVELYRNLRADQFCFSGEFFLLEAPNPLSMSNEKLLQVPPDLIQFSLVVLLSNMPDFVHATYGRFRISEIFAFLVIIGSMMLEGEVIITFIPGPCPLA
tara:strand:+ start:89 stop:463 length:375 start_codon:yes stop_codon:yes gene_type:complete